MGYVFALLAIDCINTRYMILPFVYYLVQHERLAQHAMLHYGNLSVISLNKATPLKVNNGRLEDFVNNLFSSFFVTVIVSSKHSKLLFAREQTLPSASCVQFCHIGSLMEPTLQQLSNNSAFIFSCS